MCGLAGFLAPGGFDAARASRTLTAMTGALEHRGPDDSGEWLDQGCGVALGHRRLAIIDLSAAGHQPMVSASGRFVIILNGEIYNYLELRDRLGPCSWRGHSDTETLLAGIEAWGLELTLQSARGMFALALWDRDAQALFLARDRMGEKPLYYGWQNGAFLFASELKALREHPDFGAEIDRAAVALYARRGYVPAPRTIFSGISKLIPGSILEVKPGAAPHGNLRAYWSLHDVISGRHDTLFDGSPDDAVAQLETLLTHAIREQQISDVPLGAFLSGGIDSSTVVALMQSTARVPVRTFSIGFDEQAYDEAPHARAVAQHLKTAHTELYVSSADAMSVIPELPHLYDEPFADPSQIPTVLVSRLARRHVTVALSGDGGDELFCGYGRYAQAERSWKRLSKVPLALRSLLRDMWPDRAMAEGVDAASIDEFYEFMNRQWKGCPHLVVGGERVTAAGQANPLLRDRKERMMYADALEYLPDDILAKVDRAAMSVSLETRVPLLDHRVVEFAWQLPMDIKLRQGVVKWPLKQILRKYVPMQLVERPKMGFGVPLERWLRGPLRDWAADLLAEERLKREGFFDAAPIRQHWEEHITGTRDRHYGLWTILMFQAWYERLRSTTRQPA